MSVKHRVSETGQTGVAEAVAAIREAQAAGTMGYGYIFAGAGDKWLWGGVWFDDKPPLCHEWYFVVPPDAEPFFRYGIDSMSHIDVKEYIKYIYSLIDSGQLNWYK